MRIKHLFILLFCLTMQQCNSPDNKGSNKAEYVLPVEFSKFLSHYRQQQKLFEENPLPLPLLYKEDSARVGMNYQLVAGEKALQLDKQQVILLNPFAKKPFPLSFSVIYRNRLVTLFEPGQFACYHVGSLNRDEALERKLNTRKFDYHWLVGNDLIGLSDGEYFAFTGEDAWVAYANPIPFNKQPKLFEDNQYLSFLTCNGEFGGEVYFYEKQTHKYYMTGATCPNSVFKQNGKYFVLSSLGHGFGSVDLQVIADPIKLKVWKGAGKPQDKKREYGVEQTDTAGLSHAKTVFEYYAIQVFSRFQLGNQQLYMVHWHGRTFLATIEKGTIKLVDPLFDDGLYTHNPVTINYSPDLVLMNLDFYMVGREKEIACIIIADNKLIKINRSEEKDLKTWFAR